MVGVQKRKLDLGEGRGAMAADGSFGKNMEKIRRCTDDVVSCNVIYSGTDWPLKGGGRFVNYAQAAQLLRDMKN